MDRYDHITGTVKTVALPCKSPRCPKCHSRYTHFVKKAITRLKLKNPELTYCMITLTFENEPRRKELSKIWNQYRTNILQKKNEWSSSHYLFTKERGSSKSRLHAHLLVIGTESNLIYIKDLVASTWIYGITDTIFQDSKKGDLINYLVKYLNKTLAGSEGYISKSRTISKIVKAEKLSYQYLHSKKRKELIAWLETNPDNIDTCNKNKFLKSQIRKEILNNDGYIKPELLEEYIKPELLEEYLRSTGEIQEIGKDRALTETQRKKLEQLYELGDTCN